MKWNIVSDNNCVRNRPVWILFSYFPFLNLISIFFARSPKILLILSSVSHFHTCSSLSLYHLSLSDPLNRVTEKLKRKLKSKMKQKKCDLRNKKGEEENEKRRKYLRRWNDEERVAIMKEVAFEQIVLSLVTWVGWEMGKTEIVVNRKQY